MREKLEALGLDELKKLAKLKKLKISGKVKSEIIDMLMEVHESEKGENEEEVYEGILEIMDDAKYGFLRSENFLSGSNDVFVSIHQIRKYNLKTGDMIRGYKKQISETDKFPALTQVLLVNNNSVNDIINRPRFEKLTPIYPNQKIKLLENDEKSDMAIRVIDILSPIGKGQRGLIVSPPKAGKTTLLKMIAKSILKYNKNMHLIVLLIDERPEEVTDMKESVIGKNVEIIYSTFDEQPERHKRVSEMVIERAKRLVEQKEDVVILLDSITRLTRAYNLYVPASGRTLSGGLDPNSLHMPKKFFGAARNIKEGGSLTILATALIKKKKKMDDVIYEEFKGTGNMELVLNRKLQERRVFPAIDIQKSGTRRDDLLLSNEELFVANAIHKIVSDKNREDSIEKILDTFSDTKNNNEFIMKIRGITGYEK